MKLDLPIPQDDLLIQVQTEKKEGLNFVEKKRSKFRKRLELYNNISWDDKKIYSRKIFSTIQTLLWVSYEDAMTVKFSWIQLQDDELANNIENLANFDQTEMSLDRINYQKEWDRFFYWVWIRVLDHWDTDRKVPVFKVVDPLSWIPDPYWNIWDWFRYHWFQLELTDNDLNPDVYNNTELLLTESDLELEETKNKYNEVRLLQDTTTNKNKNKSWVYWIYNHYTQIHWEKYLVTTWNRDSIILRCERIEPVTASEKKNKSVIPFPIILNYYSPFKWDPFWVSVPDLLEDKQKAEQLFLNLDRIKTENEAWWDFFLYDQNAIKNINELKTPSKWPKFLKADLRHNPNPITEVRKAAVKQDSIYIRDALNNQSALDIWLDNRALWVSGWNNITATESQTVQRNANIRLLLGNKINQWWERDFWNMWLRAYKEYFKPTDKKNILLNNAFWNIVYTVKHKDIATWWDIDVKIVNKSDTEALEEKERLWFMATVQTILADPNKPIISKAFAERKMHRLNWVSKEEISVLVPPSIEEMQANQDVALLNEDEDVWPIEDLNEDHLTYIIIYQRAIDTPAKRRAIERRQEAWRVSMQQKLQAWQTNWAQQALAASAWSQIQSKALQQTPSSDAANIWNVK